MTNKKLKISKQSIMQKCKLKDNQFKLKMHHRTNNKRIKINLTLKCLVRRHHKERTKKKKQKLKISKQSIKQAS